ncbi:MAG: sulfatase [Planctomycetes bacterium]|nr:sulfatase [Planctomycetota bacterium]
MNTSDDDTRDPARAQADDARDAHAPERGAALRRLAALGGGLGVATGVWTAWPAFEAAASEIGRQEWLAHDLLRLAARPLLAPTRDVLLAGLAGAAIGLLLGASVRLRVVRTVALRALSALGGVLLLGALVAWARMAWLDARRPPDGAPNVVWIVIDALRADALGCYGCARDTSPFVDELAASGVRFERALSQESYTLASAASYLTSTYPTTHRVLYDLPRIDTLAPGAVTLAELLSDAGYATGAFVFNPHLLARHRFDQGFDVYDDDAKAEGIDGDSPTWLAHETAAFMQRKVDAFLAATSDERPRFMYLHYRDVHGPYVPPPEYAARFVHDDWPAALRERPVADALRPLKETPPYLPFVEYQRALYDAEVAYTDDMLRRLFARLAEHGIDREHTLFVLCADHGEEFHDPHPDDEPSFSHGRTLYIEQIHVPLVLLLPGRAPPRVVREPVELLDLAPTLLDLLGRPAPSTFEGRSLRPLLDGGTRAVRPLYSGGSRQRGAVLLGDTIYLEDDAVARKARAFNVRPAPGDETRRRVELYDLASDPGETSNAAGRLRERARALHGLLDAWLRRTGDDPPTAELDEATRESLRALGYLGDER